MWAEVSKYARVIDCLGQARILAHQAESRPLLIFQPAASAMPLRTPAKVSQIQQLTHTCEASRRPGFALRAHGLWCMVSHRFGAPDALKSATFGLGPSAL
jgi:hypothetical protein